MSSKRQGTMPSQKSTIAFDAVAGKRPSVPSRTTRRTSVPQTPNLPPKHAAPSTGESTGTIPPSQRLSYSLDEAAELIGVSRSTINRMIDRGVLHCVSAMGRRLVPRQSLEQFLSN